MDDSLIAFLILGLGLTGAIGWFVWLIFYTPPSDLLQIRGVCGGPGKTIGVIKRGFITSEGRYSWFRIYSVEVTDVFGVKRAHRLGIQATFFSYPKLRDYPSR